MTRPETDTSASEESSDPTTATKRSASGSAASSDAADQETPVDAADPDALFDVLVAEGVLEVGEDRDAASDEGEGRDGASDESEGGDSTSDESRVRTTDAFDDTHAVYHDTYVGVPDEAFHEAVAATFGLSDAESAAALVADQDVSRTEFVCYLAVRSHIDREVPADDLAAMAGMVHEAVPDSPVPAALADVTDDPASLVAERDRSVIGVWKRFCDPCESLKADLGTVLDAVPDDAAVAGVDGEVAIDFCAEHAVESAPGFVVSDGTDRRTVSGGDAEAVAAAIRSFFGE